MGAVGYSVALEQFSPAEALQLSAAAEQEGFSGLMAADHFQPWVPTQGQSSFVWTFLGSAAERTRGPLGPGVTCPGFRMHPALVAQAAATLEAAYPGRTWLGLGAGEALNEAFLGQYWPGPGTRVERLFEAVGLIKRLFAASAEGRSIRYEGKHFTMESARLWTFPPAPPPIMIAAGGPVVARRAGQTADGLILAAADPAKLDRLMHAFDKGAQEAGMAPQALPRWIQIHLSWAPTMEEAEAQALREWPNGGMAFPKADIRSCHDLEQMARLVRPEDFAGRMVISEDPDVHRARLQRYLDMGFSKLYIHNVGRNQLEWLQVFGRDVLPALHG